MLSDQYFIADCMGGFLFEETPSGEAVLAQDFQSGFPYRKMMALVGVDAGFDIKLATPIMRQVAYNCIMCRTWDACQRWFTEVDGLSAASKASPKDDDGYRCFCPNVPAFEVLMEKYAFRPGG